MKTTLALLAAIASLGAAAVFWLFIADTVRLHGDALSGRRADGRFYVADHGRETEVSEDEWRTSRALETWTIATFPLGMLGGFFLLFGVVFPMAAFRGPSEERAAHARQVAASGPALASTNTSGSFGWFNAGGGMVHVDVHPGGLVARIRFVGTAAIRRDEIRSVREGSQLRMRFIAIEHSAHDVVSPIRLGCVRDVAFMAALRTLAPRWDTIGRTG